MKKHLCDQHRHVFFFYTRDFSIDCSVSATMGDTPQLLMYPCVYSLGIGIAHIHRRSVQTLIDIGTDVNAEGDHILLRNLSLPPYSNSWPCPTNLEFALSVGSYSIIKSLLRAGARITFDILRRMLYQFPPEKTSLILEEINAGRHKRTFPVRDIQGAVRLVELGCFISEDVVLLIVTSGQSDVTDKILKLLNKRFLNTYIKEA